MSDGKPTSGTNDDMFHPANAALLNVVCDDVNVKLTLRPSRNFSLNLCRVGLLSSVECLD